MLITYYDAYSVLSKVYGNKAFIKQAFLDTVIEEKCGMTIPEIFERYGEKYFRDVEKEVIAELSLKSHSVIATGGGVVLDSDNIATLRKNATIVNLEPSDDVIKVRLSKDDGTRPLNKGQDIEQILERFSGRKPFYDNCDVKVKITTDMRIEDSVQAVLDGLEGKI